MPTTLEEVTVEVADDKEANYYVRDHNGVLVARVNKLKCNGMRADFRQQSTLSGCEMILDWEDERWNDETDIDAELCHIKDHDFE